MSGMSRRSFFLVAGLGAVSLASIPAFAAIPGGEASFSAVLVDVSTMRKNGDEVRAGWVEKDLVRALKRKFGPHLERNAPRLLVEIDSLSFGDSAGGAEHSSDFLKGKALIVDKRGKVTASYPILLAQSPSATGLWYTSDFDRKRITTICDTFAAWVEKYVSKPAS